MRPIFTFKNEEEETSEGNWTRSATTARTSWKKFTLLVFCKMFAESMWKAKGWICDARQSAVLRSSEHVPTWNGTMWWTIEQVKYMKADNMNHTMWKHQWRRHLEEVCGIYSHLSGTGLEPRRRGGNVGRRSIKRTS